MKKLHIAIIIIGIIFILIPAFHQNIWFDESYSVAIVKHNIADIWNISGHDVHPPLYYWMVHIVYLIFGNNVIAFRLFSVLAIIILGILGYTHIRKDFGEKTGILFSFLTYFLPIMNTYAEEIRMYSWSCLIVALMCIYAYRFYKDKNKKNLILFGIFSILSCYIHYYALVTAGLVNLILFIYLIVKIKSDKKSFINFIILAVIQIILYIPWLTFLFGQIDHVNSGFWIYIDSVKTTVELSSFQFRRQLDSTFSFDTHTIIALIASTCLYLYSIYGIYRGIREKHELKPMVLSCGIYLGVILIVLAISLIKMPILFARYLMVMTGLYIFTFAYIISKEKGKAIPVIICAVILILGCISNITNILINYDSSNMKQIEYIKENIQDDDILIYTNIGNGGVVAAFFPEYKQYFINKDHWDVEVAYKAYGPGMETVYSFEDVLENFHGRIWLIDSEGMGLWNEFPKDDIKVLKDKVEFKTKYQNYNYGIMLLEKE